MSPHHAQEPMDPGDLEPKHRVFLCHSKAQKGFVEQLDKDLRSVDQNPFFDKDRESLPIGDHFPNLIFEAIKCCDVGVVFLSEEFFMRSHWTMFEVVKLMECGRRVMPIYLGISPRDLSNEEKVAKWKSKWGAWSIANGRIDVAKWEQTLRFLRPLNGLVYNDAVGEVKFREEIVKEVCKIVPSYHVWDDSHVQGMSRICKVIEEKILEPTISKKGVQVIGLYGVGGIGKTTACKGLCTNLALEFGGRVCCIEFGDSISELDKVREVLKRLSSTNNDFLKEKNLDECWIQLKRQLPLKKVVLAIDNVSGKSKICEEARKYLRLEYGKGSIVMVTARALGELENLGIKSGNCLAMPELVKEEARALFLYHAGCENEVDENLVMRCIRRCYFGKGDGSGQKHYHPLTLKVLGSQFGGRQPSEWKLQLEREDVFNQQREEENPVFSILGRSFDALTPEDQMLFMDVALFDDGPGGLRNFQWDVVVSHVYKEDFSWCTIFEWLSMVHGISVDRVKIQLNELKRRSLLEELGDGLGRIGMHDLWWEFAVMKAKHGEEGNSKWVYEDYVVDDEITESCMSGGGWKSLHRICIKNGSVKSVNFIECSEVKVLRLKRVYVENGVLDLSWLRWIKILEIDHWRWGLPVDDVVDEHQIVSGIGQLLNLRKLTWLRIDERLVSPIEEISCLTNLQVLHLSSDEYGGSNASTSLDIQRLRYLQNVRVALPDMVNISGFNSKMKELRVLVLVGCRRIRRCVGVGDVDNLEVLLLNRCSALEELPNLQKLTRLRILDIGFCKLLKALLGLGSLVALQEFRAESALCAMKELPCISNLTELKILDLSGCCELKCVTGVGNLVALQVLVVHSHCLQDLPNLKNLLKLQKVEISGRKHGIDNDYESSCERLQSVVNLAMLEFVPTVVLWKVDHELMNLCKLTTLKTLELRDCKFERLSPMGMEMRLESLKLDECSRFRGLDGVRGLGQGPDFQVDLCCDWTLPNLKELHVSSCSHLEVIDLSHFPQLRSLCILRGHPWKSRGFVLHCHASHLHLDTMEIEGVNIKELPDLSKFPSLQRVQIYNCDNLTSLTISEPLSALSHVVLWKCKGLHTFPNINLIPRLTYFRFCNCGAPLNEHDAQKLEARGFQDNGYGVFEITTIGKNVVPKRALELSNNNGCNVEQTKKSKIFE